MQEALTVFLKNIANLFKVKTILSLCVIITTCVLTFKRDSKCRSIYGNSKCNNYVLFYKKREGGIDYGRKSTRKL